MTSTRHREFNLQNCLAGKVEPICRTFALLCNFISELSYKYISEGLMGLDKGIACLDLKAIKCN